MMEQRRNERTPTGDRTKCKTDVNEELPPATTSGADDDASAFVVVVVVEDPVVPVDVVVVVFQNVVVAVRVVARLLHSFGVAVVGELTRQLPWLSLIGGKQNQNSVCREFLFLKQNREQRNNSTIATPSNATDKVILREGKNR